MNRIGCTSCHVQNLTINTDRRLADVETQYDSHGEEFPQLLPIEESFVAESFFPDLKRRDLGPAFHERNYDGSLVRVFVTEPLWGVGTTAPYGHDGRSINLDAVICRHGGEAQAAKQAYVVLKHDDQRRIQEFLQTRVVFPPDDTASNLNPCHPGTNDSRSPGAHGSINLGALFQIDEGPE